MALLLAPSARRTLISGVRDRNFPSKIPTRFSEQTIKKSRDTTIRLVGRFDRVASSANGPVVSDYKTSGDLSARANITTMLKADRLQVPLYWLLAERRGKIELLGAGPSYREAITEPADRRVDFDGFEDRRQEQGFLETVRTLARLVEAGTFPTHPDRHCTWCDYRTACRQKHPPTREREVVAPDSGDYRDLKKKNKSKKPLLVDTR